MWKLLSCLILLNLALACGDGFEKKQAKKTGQTQEAQEIDASTLNQMYLELVNDHRNKLGLDQLTYHASIHEISYSHSKGIGRIKLCGEIVAMGQKNIKAVFQAWLDSPKHREAIEEPRYSHSGLAVYTDVRGVKYWTQMFVEL
jgi:uncharacterized protein YkwD